MFAVNVVKVFIHALYPFVVETPYTCFAVAYSTEIGRSIGICEREFSVLSTKISAFPGKADNVLGIDDVLFVMQIELVNAALIGMAGDAVVWDTYCYPYGTFLLWPFPIISMIQTSLGSAIEKLSPSEAYPYFCTSEVITSMASLAVRERCSAMVIRLT